MRLSLLSLVLLSLAACASKDPAPAAAAAAIVADASASGAADGAPKQSCRREVPIGSNIARTVCGPVTTDEDRRRNIGELQNAIRPPTSSHGN